MVGICAKRGSITIADISFAAEVFRVADGIAATDVEDKEMETAVSIKDPALTKKSPRLFYGWLVVAGGFTVTFVGFGCVYSFSAFIDSLQQDFGASRGSVSLVFSLAGFLYFAVGTVSGPLADRWGSRRVALIGMILIGIGLALASMAQNLTQVYAAYGLGVGLGVGCSYVPAMGAVQRWFIKHRGFASGLASSGIGAGTLVVPPLAAFVISDLGWRQAYLVLGALATIIGVVAALLIENDPRDRGLNPDGDINIEVLRPDLQPGPRRLPGFRSPKRSNRNASSVSTPPASSAHSACLFRLFTLRLTPSITAWRNLPRCCW